MAHEVETMFSVRQVPWHGLGRILDHAPDSEGALVAAGLAWAVTQRDIYVDGQVVAGYKANVRAKDDKVLGIVGDQYKILQNRAAFGWMDKMLGYGAAYETAGSLQEGKTVWMLAKMPDEYKLVGDPTECYLLVSNSHDGSSCLQASIQPVRVVCRNTLNLALRKTKRFWRIRHSGDLGSKMEEGQRALGLVSDYMRELSIMSYDLARQPFPKDQWRGLVNELLPVADPAKVKRPGTIERQQEQRDILYSRIFADDLANFQWTAWGALGAVADFVDHRAPMRETQTWQESRFKQVTDGHDLLDKALAMLTA